MMNPRLWLSALLGGVLVLAGVIIIGTSAYLLLDRETQTYVPPVNPPLVSALPESEAPSPTAEPELPATPDPSIPIASIQIPRFNVNASIVVLGVDADGVMQTPSNPTDVAWYRFSARPGALGNAVFAAHVDYRNYGPAVFYNLKNLREGDEIIVGLEDGTSFRYSVISTVLYDERTAPVQEIVGPVNGEVVTLITCGGSFNQTTREYDKRVVVRAQRVSEVVRR
jgi:LPXTG-site transpeptidase (sortase) family protein